MAELVVVCGLMGSGKTTFAKEYACLKGYGYVDFDEEYHKKSKNNKKQFLNAFIKKLNERDAGFVVDNWFKWNRFWYKFDEDNTIEFIRRETGRKISFIYLFVPFDRVLKQYLGKHKRNNTMDDVLPEFEGTMGQRQENLLKKIEEALNG